MPVDPKEFEQARTRLEEERESRRREDPRYDSYCRVKNTVDEFGTPALRVIWGLLYPIVNLLTSSVVEEQDRVSLGIALQVTLQELATWSEEELPCKDELVLYLQRHRLQIEASILSRI